MIAEKTLAAIDAAMRADQGGRYRTLLRELMPTAEDAYRGEEPPFRSHLGASLIGRDCHREAWYSFHWTTNKVHDGQIIRLFNRGHLEEPRMIALLMMIGCQVWFQDAKGKQFRVHGHRGHFGGGLDGVACGIPDLPPGTNALTEYKTHNDKSFAKLVSEGVREAKWEHYVQMNIYMGKMGLAYAFYLATNKNDDRLHAEIVQFDEITYNRYLQKAAVVIDAIKAPDRISGKQGGAFYKCKFCDHSPTCHQGVAPARNCRTCSYSRVGEEGAWLCTHSLDPGEPIAKEDQLTGCEFYSQDSRFFQ